MKTFNEVTGFPGLYLWGLNAQSKQPVNSFLAMFIQGQPASLTLTKALSLINQTCLCVSDSATYWGGWQDLTNYLRSRSPNLLLFQGPDTETFLWLKPRTTDWLFDHRVRFQFKGGLTTSVLPSGDGLGFKPNDSNANILFDRPPSSEDGAATATSDAKLDLSGEDIMLELPIRLDSTCFGLDKDGEERTICPTICYSTSVAPWMMVSTPVFTQQTDTAPEPPIVFGLATVRINPLRLLYDAKASDYSRVQIHTLAALRSTFCSPTGLPLYLESLGVQNADLVFADWPGYSDQVSLNLNGCLCLTVPGSHRSSIAPAVALGAQATEYIYLSTPGSALADVVEFVAGKPARFEPDPVTELWSLNDNFTTSWVSFTQQPVTLSFALHQDAKQAMTSTAGTDIQYVRQPECAPLMAPDSSERKFRFEEGSDTIDSTAIPVLPRGRLPDAELSLANQLERLGIAPARRKALPPPAAHLGLNTPHQMRTPHGVLVDAIGDQWQRVTLAIGDYALTIDRPDMHKPWLLQDALEQPEVFLVIPPLNDASLNGLGKMAPSLGLSGWEFMFGLDNHTFIGGVDTPFMILKLCAISTDPTSPALSLVELTRDPRSWTLAEQLYPGDVPAVQAALRDVIGALKKGDPSQYNEVQSRISDGHWNGLLCLNLTMGQFPSGAAGLRAGFHNGGNALMARYLCVDQTPVRANGATLEPGASSACALIDYEASNVSGLIAAQASEAENSDRHSMVVTNLHLLIVDSRIIRFDCQLDFGLSSIFGGGFDGGNNAALTLLGKYESVMVGATRQERYSFETAKSTTLQFTPFFPPMSSIEIRHAVLTSVARLSGAGQDITTTLNLTGTIQMKDIGPSLLTLNSLDFSDAGMELRFHLEAGRWSQLWIGFAPGAMRFGVTSQPGGSLSKWPLALRGLLWSGRSRLKDVPGGPFFSRFGFFSILGLDSDLDFGLEFDLDLGSLGALAGLDSKLQASLAVGWCWPVTANKFGFGFKFRGMDGKLDIGIQHVIRLLADNVVMKTAPSPDVDIALFLKRTRVEILGREIPGSGNVDLVAFVPANSTSVAWLVSANNALGDVAGLTIDSLAVGQRVKLTGADPKSTGDLVRRWSNIQSDPNHPLAQVAFAKDGGWVLALGTRLGRLAIVDLAMSDTPALYGVRVELPDLHFSIDVLYRRISESVGVFSTEIDLPIRSMDFGAFAITLPVIGLDIFTNGDWRFDAGMPRDRDYSRSANMQFGPFIGFGGFYIGERSGETLQFRPTDVSWWVEGQDAYSPALEFGSAGRFGLGREMSKGPMRAGISLTVYGVLHGVYGTHKVLSGIDHCPREYKQHWRLQGTLGIMFEAYGYVDLGIVKASLVARAWAESGLTLEQHGEVKLYLEFGVSVDLDVVVGRIDVPFDGSWDLKVSLHWSDRLYFPYNLGTINLLARPPIDFEPFASAKRVAPLPLMLGTAPLWLNNGSAALRVNLVVPLTALTVQNGQFKPVPGGRDVAAILDLGSALLQWVLKDAQPSEALLQWIDSQLQHTTPTWQEVTGFLDSISLTFALVGARVHVQGEVPPTTDPSDKETIDAVLCPWLPGLGINAVQRDELYDLKKSEVLRSIADVHQVDQDYLDEVAAYYEKAYERILLPPPKQPVAFQALATSDATERLFTEWLMTVLRVIVASATTWLRDQNGQQASWPLLDAFLRSTPPGADASPIEMAFQGAGRILFSGMRLPPPPGTQDNLSYAELAGLVLTPAPPDMADYYVEPNWNTTQGAGRFIQCTPADWWWPRVEKKLLDELANLAQDDIVEDGTITATIKDALSKTPLMQALGRPQRLHDGLLGASFHVLPAPLMERALENASAYVFAREAGTATTDRTTGRLYDPFYWALKINVILRKGEGQVFEVVGIDLATRARLAALLNPVISASRPRALDRLPVQVTVLGAGVADPNDNQHDYPLRKIWTPGLDDFDLTALCTNLSPETFPPQSVGVRSARLFDPLARLSEASEAFLRVLYRQALTNDRHFFIGELGQNTVLSSLFDGGTGQARLSLIAALTGAPPSTHDYPLPMPDYANGVLLASADSAQRMIEFAVDEHVYEVAPNGIPGVAAVSVKRSLGAMPGGDAQAWRQAQLYHLLDYSVTGDIKVDRESVFPIFPTTQGSGVQLGDGWLYDIGLPYVNYMTPNDPSRYEGIGKHFTFEFGLRDGMGTLFPTLANSTLPYSVCYRDLLVRLQDLGVGLNFAPNGNDIVLLLQFHERLNDDYPNAGRTILEELWRQYRIAIDQLEQPDVEASLVVTGIQSRAVNEDIKSAILDALKAYQIQLRAFIDGKIHDIPATSTSIPVIADPLPKSAFSVPLLPLTVSLQIRRTGPVDAKALLLDARVQSYRAGSLPGYLAAAAGATAVTGLNTEDDWLTFQRDLRATDIDFPVARLLDRAPEQGQVSAGVTMAWLVNPAVCSVGRDTRAVPVHSAPLPLFQEPRSGVDGDGQLRQFDADATLADVAALTEMLLAPKAINGALREDQRMVLYRDVMRYKEWIAKAFSDRVRSIATSGNAPTDDAKARWYAEIASDLSAAYAISTVADVRFAPMAGADPSWSAYRLAGHAGLAEARTDELDLGMVKMPLPASPANRPCCTLVHRPRADATGDTHASGILRLRFDFIEEELQPQQGAEPRTSRWFKLVDPLVIADASMVLPRIQRRLPRSPVIDHHEVTTAPRRAYELHLWSYAFTVRSFETGPEASVKPLPLAFNGSRVSARVVGNEADLLNALAAATANLSSWRDSMAGGMSLPTMQNFVEVLGKIAQGVVDLPVTAVQDAATAALPPPLDPEPKPEPDPHGKFFDYSYEYEKLPIAGVQAVFPRAVVLFNDESDINSGFVMRSAVIGAARECSPNYALVVRSLNDLQTQPTVQDAETMLSTLLGQLCQGLDGQGSLEMELYVRLASKFNFSAGIDEQRSPSAEQGWTTYPVGIFQRTLIDVNGIEPLVSQLWIAILGELQRLPVAARTAHILVFDLTLTSPPGPPPFDHPRNIVCIESAFARWTSPP